MPCPNVIRRLLSSPVTQHTHLMTATLLCPICIPSLHPAIVRLLPPLSQLPVTRASVYLCNSLPPTKRSPPSPSPYFSSTVSINLSSRSNAGTISLLDHLFHQPYPSIHSTIYYLVPLDLGTTNLPVSTATSMVPHPQPRDHPPRSTTIPNPSPINPNHYMNQNPFNRALMQHPPRPPFALPNPPPSAHPRPPLPLPDEPPAHAPRPPFALPTHPALLPLSHFWYTPPTYPLTDPEAHRIRHNPSAAPIDKGPFPAVHPGPLYNPRPPPVLRNRSDSASSTTSDASNHSVWSTKATYGGPRPLPPSLVASVHNAATNKAAPLKDLPFRTRSGNHTTNTAMKPSPVTLPSNAPPGSYYNLTQTFSNTPMMEHLNKRLKEMNRRENERQQARSAAQRRQGNNCVEDERQWQTRSALIEPHSNGPSTSQTGADIALSAGAQVQESLEENHAINDGCDGLFPGEDDSTEDHRFLFGLDLEASSTKHSTGQATGHLFDLKTATTSTEDLVALKRIGPGVLKPYLTGYNALRELERCQKAEDEHIESIMNALRGPDDETPSPLKGQPALPTDAGRSDQPQIQNRWAKYEAHFAMVDARRGYPLGGKTEKVVEMHRKDKSRDQERGHAKHLRNMASWTEAKADAHKEKFCGFLERTGTPITRSIKQVFVDELVKAGMQGKDAEEFVDKTWPVAQAGAEAAAQQKALTQKRKEEQRARAEKWRKEGGVSIRQFLTDESVGMEEGPEKPEDEKAESIFLPRKKPYRDASRVTATQKEEIPLTFRKKHAKEDPDKYVAKVKAHIRAYLTSLTAPATCDDKKGLQTNLVGAGMDFLVAGLFVTGIAEQAEAVAATEAAQALAHAQKEQSRAARRYAPLEIRDNPAACELWKAVRAENAELMNIVDEADEKVKDLRALQARMHEQLAIAGDAGGPSLHVSLAAELEVAGMSLSAALAWVEQERLLVKDEEEGKQAEKREREKLLKLEKWKVKRAKLMENMAKFNAEVSGHGSGSGSIISSVGEEITEKTQEARDIAVRYAERITTKGTAENEKAVKPSLDTPYIRDSAELHDHRKRGSALGGDNWLRVDIHGEMCALDGQIYAWLNKARSTATAPPKDLEGESSGDKGKGKGNADETPKSSAPPEPNSRPPSPATQQDAEKAPKQPEQDPRKALSCTGYPDCFLRFRIFDGLARHIEDCPIENPPTDAEGGWNLISGPSTSPSPSSSSSSDDEAQGERPHLSFECVGFPRCTRRFTRQEDLENHIEYSHNEDFAFPDFPARLNEWSLVPRSSSASPSPSDPNTFNPLTSPRHSLLPLRPKPRAIKKPGPRLTLRGGCISTLLPQSWTTRLDDDAEVPAALWYFTGGKPPKKGEKLPTGKQLREWKKKSKGEGWGEKGRGEVREFGYVVSRGKYFRDKKDNGGGAKKDGDGDGDGGGNGDADDPDAPPA